MHEQQTRPDYFCVLSRFSHIRLCTTLWTIACQAPLLMGFSRQEYWSGLPCPPPGDPPDPGIEPASLMSLALAGGFFTTSANWEAPLISYSLLISVQSEEIQPTTTLRNPTSFSLTCQQQETQINNPSCFKHLLDRLAGNHGLPASSYFTGGPSESSGVP